MKLLYLIACVLLVWHVSADCEATCDTCQDAINSAFLCIDCADSGHYIYTYTYRDPFYGFCADDDQGVETLIPVDTTRKLYFLDGGCPVGYFNLDGVCTACDATCYECTGATSTDCTSCEDSIMQKESELAETGSCVTPALGTWDGYTGTTSVTKCHDDCTNCFDTSIADCATCADTKPVRAFEYPTASNRFCIDECVNASWDEDANLCIMNAECPQYMERSGQKCVGK